MLFNKKPEADYPYASSAERQSSVVGVPNNQAAISHKVNGAPPRSVIDPWLTITGDLQSEGEVQVDGQIHGNIRCAHLTVGRDATLVGDITADEVAVRGNVKGTIRANRVILQDSARVESEIFHKKLAIEEGACFEGQARFREDPTHTQGQEAKSETAKLQAMAPR